MIIYMVKNNINGKVYIGKTKRSLQLRWKEHCYASHYHMFKLQEDILKYGEENFTIMKIDEAINDEDACEKEIYWIEYYNSIFPSGYNISKGGKNGGNIKKIMNVETGEIFESISEASRKYKRNVEAIRKVLDKPHRTSAGYHWITK